MAIAPNAWRFYKGATRLKRVARMAFENLEAFRGGFAWRETLKRFQLGAMGNLEVFWKKVEQADDLL